MAIELVNADAMVKIICATPYTGELAVNVTDVRPLLVMVDSADAVPTTVVVFVCTTTIGFAKMLVTQLTAVWPSKQLAVQSTAVLIRTGLYDA